MLIACLLWRAHSVNPFNSKVEQIAFNPTSIPVAVPLPHHAARIVKDALPLIAASGLSMAFKPAHAVPLVN
jgi:hypothetical protein